MDVEGWNRFMVFCWMICIICLLFVCLLFFVDEVMDELMDELMDVYIIIKDI